MTKNRHVALLVAAAVTLAAAQGCAVSTGPYHASRAPIASHSMVSRFDVMRSQSVGGSPLRMPRERPTGPMYFRY